MILFSMKSYSIVHHNMTDAVSGMISFKYDGRVYVVTCFIEDVLYDKSVDGIGNFEAPIRIYKGFYSSNVREKASEILSVQKGKYYETNKKHPTPDNLVNVAYGFTNINGEYKLYGSGNYYLFNDGYLVLSFYTKNNGEYQTYLYVFKYNNKNWDVILLEKFDYKEAFDFQQVEYDYSTRDASIITHGIYGNIEGVLKKKNNKFEYKRFN